MIRMRLKDLPDNREGHFLKGVIPGEYLCMGGLGYKKPNQRSHDVGCKCSNCDGKGRHVHEGDREVFILLQGKAVMELNGELHPMVTGDVVICEPGEDHHLVADSDDPCINLWLHAGDERHKDQGMGSST